MGTTSGALLGVYTNHFGTAVYDLPVPPTHVPSTQIRKTYLSLSESQPTFTRLSSYTSRMLCLFSNFFTWDRSNQESGGLNSMLFAGSSKYFDSISVVMVAPILPCVLQEL